MRLNGLVAFAGASWRRAVWLLPGLLMLSQAIAQSGSSGSLPGHMAKPRTACEAKLDGFLRERRFSDLFETVNGKDVDTVDRALEWLRVELNERGQGAAIGYMYALQLFRAGSTLPGIMGDAFKQAALTIMVMTRWMVATEQFQCVDTSSAATRLQMLDLGFRSLDQHYRSIDHQREVLVAAFQQLKARYPHRVDDEWLCSGGPRYAAAHAAKHAGEVVPPSAYDPELRAEIRPADEWRAQREQALHDIIRTAREQSHVELR
jgi:hypothetical protein